MSVNIQQADKTLKKVADTTVVNKTTVIGALEYTPASTDQLNTAKTELTNSINTAKTDLTNSIGEVSSNLSTTANNLQQQIDALEGSAFDGDYNKLTNAPILNDADGTATFADEAGNIIARIDNNGFETTNLNLHGDIELADEKLEIIDETGNIVLRIDDNGVETATTEELKTQVGDIDAQAKANTSSIQKIQEDLEIFNFDDESGLTLADEQGNIIAKFDVAEDGSQTGLITTDVTFEYEEDKTKTLTALNAEVAANATEIGKNTKSIGDNAVAIATKAPIANPEFTGTPKAPSPIDNSSQRVATTDYVDNSVAGLQEDIDDVFKFDDDGALTITDEAGNILAQFAVTEDTQGNVIETGLRVTDVSTNEINSLNTKISDIDDALNARYTKDKVYNKTETDSAISTAVANAEHLKRTIVDAVDKLPTTGDKCVIYMVKAEATEKSTQDLYDEYMYINNAWERLGSWQTDLSGYVTGEELDTLETELLANIGKKVSIDQEPGNDGKSLVINNYKVTPGYPTKLNTARKIKLSGDAAGVASFDGSADIEITTTISDLDNKVNNTEFNNHVTEYNTFKTDFDEKFNFETNENSLNITDGDNIIATFNADGLRTTTVILGNTNDEILIDLMNIDYDNLFAFDVNEIVGEETSPVEFVSN